MSRSFIELSPLQDNQEEVLVGGHQNLLLVFASDSEEGQVVLGVDVTHHGARLLGQLGDLLCDLDGVLILVLRVHGRAEHLAILIDDEQADNASVLLDSKNALFNFRHLIISNYFQFKPAF